MAFACGLGVRFKSSYLFGHLFSRQNKKTLIPLKNHQKCQKKMSQYLQALNFPPKFKKEEFPANMPSLIREAKILIHGFFFFKVNNWISFAIISTFFNSKSSKSNSDFSSFSYKRLLKRI